jgi:adenylate kinase
MKAAVIFLGAPGSGKGTQSKHLVQDHGLPVLGMGDLLRKEVAKENENSKKISSLLDKGDIVPWNLTRQIFKSNVDALRKKNILILDGVPRNIEQAIDVDEILQSKGFESLKVIHLDVETSFVEHRLSHRLICTNCQAPFSDEESTECPFCACSKYEIRTDDNIDSIKSRISFHKKNMHELLMHYKKKNALLEVDANQSIQEVKKDIRTYIADLL